MRRRGKDFKFLPRTRVITKGLNSHARGKLLKKIQSQFKCPVWFKTDQSKQEAHIGGPVLAEEHMVYKMCDKSQELREQLSKQVKLQGKTNSGIKYKVRTVRASGHPNTACGNSLVQTVGEAAHVRFVGIVKYAMVVDGDDCCVCIEDMDAVTFQATCGPFWRKLGFEVTVEGPFGTLSELEFCHTRVQDDEYGVRCIRDWKKVLRTCFCSNKHYDTPGGFRVMRAITDCEQALGVGVPILQSYFAAWDEKLTHLRPATLDSTEALYYRVKTEFGGTPKRVAPVPITAQGRSSFELAWGVPTEQQIALEKYLVAEVAKYELLLTGVVTEQGPELLDGGIW